MDVKTYESLKKTISEERLAVYKADGASSVVQKNLAEIRYLRNRIAHHERISHWKDLEQKHDLLMNFICWLNPDMYTIASKEDTFCNVFKQGIQPFLIFVENEL